MSLTRQRGEGATEPSRGVMHDEHGKDAGSGHNGAIAFHGRSGDHKRSERGASRPPSRHGRQRLPLAPSSRALARGGLPSGGLARALPTPRGCCLLSTTRPRRGLPPTRGGPLLGTGRPLARGRALARRTLARRPLTRGYHVSPPLAHQDAMRFRRRRSRSLMPPHTPYRSSRRSA